VAVSGDVDVKKGGRELQGPFDALVCAYRNKPCFAQGW
jgi:hypothetical protein